jgi:hypothetical protein
MVSRNNTPNKPRTKQTAERNHFDPHVGKFAAKFVGGRVFDWVGRPRVEHSFEVLDGALAGAIVHGWLNVTASSIISGKLSLRLADINVRGLQDLRWAIPGTGAMFSIETVRSKTDGRIYARRFAPLNQEGERS